MFESAQDWHRNRYGRPDQGLVDRLERRLLWGLLAPYAGRLPVVLDAPAGYGRLSSLLARLDPELLVSLELRPQRTTCVDRGHKRLTIQGDLRQLPLAPRSVDLALCFRFLHHFSRWEEVPPSLARLCGASRNLLALSYYGPSALHRGQRELVGRLRGRPRPPLGWHEPARVQAWLEEEGFRVLADRRVLPGLHAQRVLLAARMSRT